MEGLNNRNKIINFIYDNIDNLTTESSISNGLLELSNNLIKIKRDENYIDFYILISGYIKSYVVINYVEFIHILRYNIKTTSMQMISASSDDNWAEVYISNNMWEINSTNTVRAENIAISTKLNEHYQKIPSTKEEHFQRGTTDGIALNFEECLKLIEIIKKVESYGSIIKLSDTHTMFLTFK